MTTWRNTQKSLNLPDSEFSKKVKNRIAIYDQYVIDLADVKAALASGKLPQDEKEQAEIAKKELETRIFDSNAELTKDMIRLDRDKDINARRREILAKEGGFGRGRKKDRPATATVPVKEPEPAATTPVTATADPKTEPPVKKEPATPPKKETTDPPKKKTYAGVVIGAIVAFVGGAFLGKKMQ